LTKTGTLIITKVKGRLLEQCIGVNMNNVVIKILQGNVRSQPS